MLALLFEDTIVACILFSADPYSNKNFELKYLPMHHRLQENQKKYYKLLHPLRIDLMIPIPVPRHHQIPKLYRRLQLLHALHHISQLLLV